MIIYRQVAYFVDIGILMIGISFMNKNAIVYCDRVLGQEGPLVWPSESHKSAAEKHLEIDSRYLSGDGTLSRPKYIYCWENSSKTTQAWLQF